MQSQTIEMKHFRSFQRFRCSVAGVLLGLAALSQAQSVVSGYPLFLPSSPSVDITNPVAAHAWPTGTGITVVAATYGNAVYALKIFDDDSTATNTYSPASGYSLEPKAVKIGSDNKAYVACKLTQTSTGHTWIQVLRYSSGLTGPSAYTAYNGGYDQCEPVDLVVDSSGNVFVTGTVQDATSGTDTIVVGFNTSGASRVPTAVYAGPNSSLSTADVPTGIALDTGGNVVVGVSSYSTSMAGTSLIPTVLSYVASTGSANATRQWIPASSPSPFTAATPYFAFYNNHLWMAGTEDYSTSPGPGAFAADFDCSSSGDLVGTGIVSYSGHTNSSADTLLAISSSAYGTHAIGKFDAGGGTYDYKLIDCTSSPYSVVTALSRPRGTSAYVMDSLGSSLFTANLSAVASQPSFLVVHKFGGSSWAIPGDRDFPVDDGGSSLLINRTLACANQDCYVIGTIETGAAHRQLMVIKFTQTPPSPKSTRP